MWNLERMRGAGQILELFWGRCHRGFAFGTVRGDLGRIRAVSVPGASLGNLSKLRFSFLSSLNFGFLTKNPFLVEFQHSGEGAERVPRGFPRFGAIQGSGADPEGRTPNSHGFPPNLVPRICCDSLGFFPGIQAQIPPGDLVPEFFLLMTKFKAQGSAAVYLGTCETRAPFPKFLRIPPICALTAQPGKSWRERLLGGSENGFISPQNIPETRPFQPLDELVKDGGFGVIRGSPQSCGGPHNSSLTAGNF